MSGTGTSPDAPAADDPATVDPTAEDGRVADGRPVDGQPPVAADGPAGDRGGDDPGTTVMALAPVRSRVVELAAGAMTGMAVPEIPAPLRRVAQFTPGT